MPPGTLQGLPSCGYPVFGGIPPHLILPARLCLARLPRRRVHERSPGTTEIGQQHLKIRISGHRLLFVSPATPEKFTQSLWSILNAKTRETRNKKPETKSGMAGKSTHDSALREHVLFLLRGGGAHAGFDAAVEGLPKKLRGTKAANIPHTPWRLLEHMRLAQFDIVDFCVNPEYHERAFPDDYWPASDGPESDAAWDRSIQQFHRDLKNMEDLVSDPKTDLFATIPWGDGQTYLREALLVAAHNANHIGQLITLRRALCAWK